MIPADSPVQLVTDALKDLIPGLYEKYGLANMSVGIEANNITNFDSFLDNPRVNVDIETTITLYVDLPTEKVNVLALSINAISCEGSIIIEGLSLTGNVNDIAFGEIKIGSEIFVVDGHILSSLLNEGMRYGIPYFNSWV